MHHSEKNGRVRQTFCSRSSTATIEYMSGQPRLSVRRPRFGFASSAARVNSTGVIVLIRTCLVGNACVTAFDDREPVGVGDPRSVADVPLAIAAVAADVDVAQPRVVAVTAPELGHQLPPLGEEGR